MRRLLGERRKANPPRPDIAPPPAAVNPSQAEIDTFIAAVANPRTYQDGASAVLRIGPMPEVSPIEGTPTDWIDLGVVVGWEPPLSAARGEYYHREAFDEVFGPDDGFYLADVDLVREPANVHDSNAIRVECDGKLLAYIKRELAEVVAPTLDAAHCPRLKVPGLLHADGDERRIFLWLRRRLSPGPALPIPVEWADANLGPQASDGRPEALEDELPIDEIVADPSFGPWSDMIDRFNALNGDAHRALDDRDLDRVVAVSFEALAMLPKYASALKAQQDSISDFLRPYAPELVDNPRTSVVRHADAITLGASVLVARADREALAEMRDALARCDAAPALVDHVESLLREETVGRAVMDYVEEHPGVLQKDLYTALGLGKQEVSFACYLLASGDRLARVKHGNSYELTVASKD